jgi:hypothetical protein
VYKNNNRKPNEEAWEMVTELRNIVGVQFIVLSRILVTKETAQDDW